MNQISFNKTIQLITKVIAIMIISLMLCELFFYFNLKYKWVSPKNAKVEDIKEDPITINPVLPNRKTEYLSIHSEFFKNNKNIKLDYSKKVPSDTLPNTLYFVNGRSYVKISNSNQYLYDVDLTFNNEKTVGKGYRHTVQSSKADKFLIMLGDSFIFGEGVESDETLPSLLAKYISDYKIYNFGVFGTGPGDHLFKLKTDIDKRFEDVKEAEGDIVYYHLPFHILRTLCNLECFRKNNKFMLDKPHYVLNNKKLELKSDNQRVNLFKNFFLELIANSSTLESVGFELFSEISTQKYETYIAIIDELFLEAAKKVKIRNRILVLDPVTPGDQAEILTKLAATYKITVINLSNRSWHKKYYETLDWRLPIDLHPTPEKNHYLAQVLAPYLNKLK